MTLPLAFLALAIPVAIAIWILLKIFIQRRYEGLVKSYSWACARHGLTPEQVPLGPYDLMLLNHGLEPEAPKDYKMREIDRRIEQNRLSYEKFELELAQSRTPDPDPEPKARDEARENPRQTSISRSRTPGDLPVNAASLGFLKASRLRIPRRKTRKPPKG
jgi:hypothetical protein